MRLLVIILMFLSFNTKACTCSELDKMTVEDYNSSSVIFKGVVQSVSVDTANLTLTVVFEVSSQMKGEKAEIIEISTINGGSACGLTFKVGQKWFIQARLNDGEN